MKPPTFSKAEDPLDAEAWIKAIEAKFSAFVMPCSWNDFKQAFKSHHIPKGLMDRKMRELLALR
jgi:hypothetical protein